MSAPDIELTPEGRSQAIAGVNVKLGGAVLCAIGSYALWPSSIEWWGFGVHSILLGLGAGLSVLGAVRDMATLRRVEQALAIYRALGTGPKGAHMADGDAMRAAGMQDAQAVKTSGGLFQRLRAPIGGAS